MNWPPLSEFSAVTKRAATREDVSAGRAVFVLQDSGEPIGEAIDIDLPQYAFHLDAVTDAKTPCILLQAEHARGQRLAGVQLLPDRSVMAGQLDEFELLGTSTPQSPFGS